MMQSVKKTALTIFLLMLFIVLLISVGVLCLTILQWVMHTDYYLNLVSSIEFWKWMLGVPLIILFFVFCANISSCGGLMKIVR